MGWRSRRRCCRRVGGVVRCCERSVLVSWATNCRLVGEKTRNALAITYSSVWMLSKLPEVSPYLYWVPRPKSLTRTD